MFARRPSRCDAPPAAPGKEPTLPTPAQATLEEAERLLGQHGEKLAGPDRTSLQHSAQELRKLMTTRAAPEEVERTRSALRMMATRVKESLLSRRSR